MAIEKKISYFHDTGSANTIDVFSAAKLRASELGIKTVLIASTSGDTAVEAVKFFIGMRVIIVTHSAGFQKPNTQQFTDENRRKVEAHDGQLLTTTHAFAGVSRAMRKKFDMYMLGEVIANTLRIFGHGTKVACEIAIMAADAGLVRTDEDVISIGGTSHGADTALVLKPVNADDFFDLKVQEIICKPHF
jgi:hypothetical protein